MRFVRQALVRQLDNAIAGLEQPSRAAHAVHEVRKELKRARAMLRLLRACIGVTAYRRENTLIRDAARPLTPVRDAKVLVESLRGMFSGESAAGDNAFVRQLHRGLGQERRVVQSQLRPQDLNAVAEVLREIRSRVQGITVAQLDRASLAAGLERAYKCGRKAFARVRQRATDERLHEWRKQAKYFSNQLEIVLPRDSKRFAKGSERCLRLVEHLGEDHDLALLNARLFCYAEAPNAAGQDQAVGELVDRLARRRKALQKKALRLGRRLYSITARRLLRKIEKGRRNNQALVSS
jgi:CHAD domain-containing protein